MIPDELEEPCIQAIMETAQTGKIGDGKIFVYDVGRVIRIRTGEENEEAIWFCKKIGKNNRLSITLRRTILN